MQSARNALRCFGTIAVSFFVLSAAPAFGEPTTNEADVHGTEAAASAVTLAALVPAALSSDEIETERPSAPPAVSRTILSAEGAIVGIASFYDEPQKTASGEEYDPNAYTAAAQLAIRDRFGGIRYGRLYQPAYGLGEYEDKKIIVRFNDVGPLRPGRKFDLSRAAMTYFDSTLDKGLLPDFRMTPLPLGRTYPVGPVTNEQLADLGIEQDWTATACADVLDEPIHTASIAPPKPETREAVRPVQPKPSSVVHARAKAKVAAKAKAKAAAKAKVAKANVKKIKTGAKPAAKIKAAAAAAAPQQTGQAPHPVTPWVKRVVNWVASKSAAETPAPANGARVASKAAAQAR